MVDCTRGLLFDVQRFSVHDGPGLRTTVFLKGCPLRCRWCQNPESLRREPELLVTRERCLGCGRCRKACPTAALPDGAPSLVRSRCDGCGACVAGCPSEALKLVGRSVAPGELADELVRDRAFFDASGGGVTLSGGEPTAQPAFCAALVRELRAREVRVGLETCGLFRWAAVEGWLGLLDFVLFDLKIMDDARHRLHTGAGNERILANARQMVAEGLPVRFRLPIVPGFTDDDTNVARVGALLAELGVTEISLLRYHSMGEAKIARVGAPLGPLGIDAGPSAHARLAYAKTRLTAFGLEVTT